MEVTMHYYTGCQLKTFKTFILIVKPLKPLFFSEKSLKTFIFLRKNFIFRKSCFFSVFRVPRSYKILYFQQCPILFYILSICLIFQGIKPQHRENTECIVCVYDDVWGIYSGEYISQLYVRGRPHVHLSTIL